MEAATTQNGLTEEEKARRLAEQILRVRIGSDSVLYYLDAELGRFVSTYKSMFVALSQGKPTSSGNPALNDHFDDCHTIAKGVSRLFKSFGLSNHEGNQILKYYLKNGLQELPKPSDDEFLKKIEAVGDHLQTMAAYFTWLKNGATELPIKLKEFVANATDRMDIGIDEAKKKIFETGTIQVDQVCVLMGVSKSTAVRFLKAKNGKGKDDGTAQVVKFDSGGYCAESFFKKAENAKRLLENVDSQEFLKSFHS